MEKKLNEEIKPTMELPIQRIVVVKIIPLYELQNFKLPGKTDFEAKQNVNSNDWKNELITSLLALWNF